MKKLATHKDVLNYKNPLVIQRFQKKFPAHHEQADVLFTDMLQYLWLCRKFDYDKTDNSDDPNLNFTCTMHEEMMLIDEMWHTFILMTKDYAAFCHEFFGEFLHHIIPEADEGEINLDAFQNELELFLSYVYEHLGEETVRRWFSVYLQDETI